MLVYEVVAYGLFRTCQFLSFFLSSGRGKLLKLGEKKTEEEEEAAAEGERERVIESITGSQRAAHRM